MDKVILFALIPAISTVVIVYLLLKWTERSLFKLRNKVREKTMNELTVKGMFKKQGEVGLIVKHVDNAEIVDEFIRAFNDAYTKTAYCSEFHDGEVRLWFKIEDVKIAEKIKKQLEEAGFYVA